MSSSVKNELLSVDRIKIAVISYKVYIRKKQKTPENSGVFDV